MRVIIINTELMQETDDAVRQAFESGDLSDAAIAVPLYGTTLTHYSVLNAEYGLKKLQEWHRSLHDRGIREVRGNGAVRDLVAAGACRMGWTDTDDAFGAIDDGKPVRMIPARTDSGRTIVIPNSVAMIAGCRHPREAEQFI
ncbi:MAG: ABC transporter substrate-binding protein, partial [Phycisphaerae bacterium]